MKIRQRSADMAILAASDSSNTSPSSSASALRPRGGQGAVPGEDREIPRERRRGQQRGEGGQRVGDGHGGALRLPLRRAPSPGRRPQIDEAAAADGALRRHVPEDVAIRQRGGDRPVEHQLDLGRPAGLDRIVAEQDDARARPRPPRDAAAPETTGRSASPRPAAGAAGRRYGPSAHAIRGRAPRRRAGSSPWRCPGPPNSARSGRPPARSPPRSSAHAASAPAPTGPTG